MTNTRNHPIDLLRLVSAFSVVCLHNFSCSGVACSEEVVALARFAVPLFFIFSGYFAAGFTPRRKWKQALKIFLLALFSNLAYLAVDLARQTSPFAVRYRLKELFSAVKIRDFLLFNESPISGHLWFLSALLYCILLDLLFTLVTKRLKHRAAFYGVTAALLLLCGLALYQVFTRDPAVEFQLYYYRNFFFLGLPFFLIGKLLWTRESLRRPLPKWGYLLLIFGSCVLTLVEFKLLGVWELYLGSAVLAAALAHLAVCHSLAEPKRPVRALAWLGRYASLPVYIVHLYFLDRLKGAYYANLPWQYEFGLYHLLALFAFLISLAVGAAVGAVICLLKNKRQKGAPPSGQET